MFFDPITTFVRLYTSREQRPAGNSRKNFSGNNGTPPAPRTVYCGAKFFIAAAQNAQPLIPGGQSRMRSTLPEEMPAVC
jgi:hypothetical protein